MVLVCLYQLSFTWVANREGKKAEDFANSGIDQSLTGEARKEAVADKKASIFLLIPTKLFTTSELQNTTTMK